jgi:hypothetical protein
MGALIDGALDLLLSPALWLSIVVATLVSLAFTAWRGGDLRQLLRDLVAGLIGFGAGQLLGSLLPFSLLRIGEIHIVWGVVGSLAGLLSGRSIHHWREQRIQAAQPRRARR